jgi:hypothetical protein
LEELNHELEKYATEEIESDISAQLILQAYSMKPTDELEKVLSNE